MSDEPRKPKLVRKGPSSLVRAMETGRARGGALMSGDVAELGAGAKIADVQAQLEEVERRLAAGNALWEREWAAMMLRGILRSLAADRDDPRAAAVLERTEMVRDIVRARDREELGPTRERLERGEYSPDDLKRDLSTRPVFEWDAFVERVFAIDEVPRPEKGREEDMVHYLASPMEAILELVAELEASDVLYDLGCGLGKVAMLAAFLSPARAKGVEMEPAYVRCARERILAARLERAEILEGDARDVDYSDGTVFYFYDPFRGEILASVLAKLENVAGAKPIRVASRGKSNAVMDETPWLLRVKESKSGLSVYRSR